MAGKKLSNKRKPLKISMGSERNALWRNQALRQIPAYADLSIFMHSVCKN